MRRLRRVALIGAALAVGAVLAALLISGISASLPDVSTLASRVPARTALMRQRVAEARDAGRRSRVDQRWVPYPRISPLLRRAVLIAEDDAFFSHDGLDWHEIRASVRRNVQARRVVRGGSTITQQLARNLYLGNARTVTRKLREILLAGRIERALTKRRIFEIYLNVIEWGDGIYGIEAAAQKHFGVPAAALDARQSALLAAVIINPRRFDPARPTGRTERRARMILGRMRRRGLIGESEYLAAIGRAPPPSSLFEWLLGRPMETAAPADTGPPAETAAPEDATPPADTTGPPRAAPTNDDRPPRAETDSLPG